jgi:hypothetical protein
VKSAGKNLPADVLLITGTFDEAAKKHLEDGGRVWLMADREQFHRDGDALFFPGAGGALGTSIEDHPALHSFPHEGLLDLQFYSLIQGGWWFPLDEWPVQLTPICGAIRTTSNWLSKKKDLSQVAFIFEVGVGPGKLLVTTMNLRPNMNGEHPEALFMFDCLLRYACGDAFVPQCSITMERLSTLVESNGKTSAKEIAK